MRQILQKFLSKREAKGDSIFIKYYQPPLEVYVPIKHGGIRMGITFRKQRL